ncbi:GAF domain-containing protein [Mesorhizobium sp. ZMM04-5]|uniref:histidine kinase n=1 Tax=Mesorhizobium marinum TaxID=3228790 RepID=A0ABV3QUQ5_9HYPH
MAKAAKVSKSASDQPARRLRVPLILKFASALVLLVGLLLAAAAAVSLWQGYQEAERGALAVEQQKAEAIAARIDGLMSTLETQLAWTAQPDWRASGIDRQRADFSRLLGQFPAITELFYIDSRGFEQLKLSRLAPESVASMTVHRNEPRFTETVANRTWIGPVYVRNGTDMAGTIGIAHADGGVTVAEIDLSFLADPLKAIVAEGEQAFVIDRAGRLVAHPDRNPATSDSDLSALPQVAAALAAGGRGTSTAATMMDGDEAAAFAAWAQIPRVGWTAIAQTSREAALAPFQMLLWQTALLIGGGLLLAAMVGVSLARRVTSPIRKLQASAELLGEGDLTQRVNVSRRDEIGSLADKFNIMANRLQQSQKGLVAKIDDSAVGYDVALQQQSISTDMVRTISRSGYDLERVLNTLIDSTVRLSEANVGAVWLRDGDAFRLAAQLGHSSDWVAAAREAPFTKDTDAHAVAAAAAYSGQVINIDDITRDLRFMGEYGERPANSDERAALAIPLKNGDRVEAVFSLSRADPIPFIDRQVALAQDFADQALIAIRTVRLTETIAGKDRDLADSLDEQAATRTIARAVGRGPADVQAALDAITENAARLCKARYCHIALLDGSLLRVKAHRGLPRDAEELIATPAAPVAGGPAEKALGSCETVRVADLQAQDMSADDLTRLLAIRSLVAVPLVRGDQAIGVMTVADPEPNAVPERRLALLRTFADQAVVALDNARLSEELATRGSELESTLGQLAERTADRDDWRNRHAGDLEAGAKRHAAELEEARRLHKADVDEARQTLEATEERHAAELAEARRLHQADVDEARQTLEATEERHAAELEEARRLHQADVEEARLTLEATEQQHAAALAEARRLHQADVEEARQTLEATEERHAVELAEARRLHQADIDEARQTLEATEARHAAELAEARRLHQADIDEAGLTLQATEQRHADELAEARRLHQADIDEASRTLEAMRQGHTAELDEIRRQHAAELEHTGQLHATELDDTRKQHADAMDEARTNHAMELDQVHQLHAAEIGEARKQHIEDRDDAEQVRSATTHALRLLADVEGEPQRMLDAAAAAALTLCRAGSAQLLLLNGGVLHLAASDGSPDGENSLAERALAETRAVQVAGNFEDAAPKAELAVPITIGEETIGVLALSRASAGAFGRDEVELAGILAAEAGVAIASARLAGRFEERGVRLDDTQRELDEATAHQMATADVLRVLNDAAFDLPDALAALADHAQRLAAASSARLYLRDGERLEFAVGAGLTEDQRSFEIANPQPIDRRTATGRAASETTIVQHADSAGSAGSAAAPDAERFGQVPALLCVPLVHRGTAIGVLTLTRAEATPFADRQVVLAKTLADEAVVAIEQVRLSDDVAAREKDRRALLRQQAAIATVLEQVSRPPFNLDGVLTALTAAAASSCEAGGAAIHLLEDDAYRVAAATGAMPSELVRPQPADRDGWIGLAASEGTVLHVSDTDMEAEDAGIARISGLAAILCVPLLRDGKVAGVLVLTRHEAKPFSEHQVALARIFADEAVLSIDCAVRSDETEARNRERTDLLRDLHAARSRLAEADRLASLGQLIPAIGHDIEHRLAEVNDVSRRSNRLVDDIRMVLEAAVIDGRTRAEVEELGDTLKEQLVKAVWNGERAESVVRSTLLQSFDGPGSHRPVDINAVVDESLGLAYQGARAGREDFRVALEKTFDPKAGTVDLYPQELTRALTNVFANGLDATERRGAAANGGSYEPTLTASTRNLGDAVEITIRDNGTGIDASVREKMFDPFFTTKPAGEGTGLGLSQSRDIIVNQHAGRIEVETQPGSFTEFRIVLPRGGAALAGQGGEKPAQAAQSS